MKKAFALLVIVFILFGSGYSAANMKELLSNPNVKLESVFFGQRYNTRLDMIDYYEAGSETFSNDDVFNSKIRIDKLEDRYVRFISESPVSIEMYLPHMAKDSIVVKVINLPIGNGDTFLYIDDIKTGQNIEKIEIKYSDWLVKNALQNISENRLLTTVPFVTSSANVDTITGMITLTNTSITIPGIDKVVVDAFVPKLTLRWNGKKYVLTK